MSTDEVEPIGKVAVEEQNALPNPTTSMDWMMINKQYYHKFLEKTDPKKSEEHRLHLSKLNDYKTKILEITADLLNSPNKQINNDVNDGFLSYTKTLIHYIEANMLEDGDGECEDEEETLFGKMEKTPIYSSNTSTSSYWGKEKVVKSYPYFIPRIDDHTK